MQIKSIHNQQVYVFCGCDYDPDPHSLQNIYTIAASQGAVVAPHGTRCKFCTYIPWYFPKGLPDHYLK